MFVPFICAGTDSIVALLTNTLPTCSIEKLKLSTVAGKLKNDRDCIFSESLLQMTTMRSKPTKPPLLDVHVNTSLSPGHTGVEGSGVDWVKNAADSIKS